MARWLALEWDSGEARFVVARTQGGEVVVEEAFAAPLDAGGQDNAKVAVQIAAALASRRVSRCDTLLAVGRANVELRVLSLPPAPENELPDLVRFQAMRDFSALQEDWPLDFFPIHSTGQDNNEVLAAAISPQQMLQLQAPIAEAGNEVQHLVLRPCATSSLACRQLPRIGSGINLVIGRLADSVELTIVVNRTVVFMRSFRLPVNWQAGESGEPVLGEVRRTIAAAHNQLEGSRVERIVLCGSGADAELLQRRLQDKIDLTVDLLNPLDGVRLSGELGKHPPDHPERYAALLGMLRDEAGETPHAIDFLNPRRKPAPPSNRRSYAIAGSVAAVVVLGLISLVALRFGSLDDQVNTLKAELNGLNNENKKNERFIKEVAELDKWKIADINWLEEFRRVSEKLPPPDKTRIEQVQVTGRDGEGGRLVIRGRVDERSSLAELEGSLGDATHEVIPGGDSSDTKDPQYNWQFNDTILISNPIEPDQPPAREARAVELPAEEDTTKR